MKLEALEHPKTLELAAQLEVELPTAIGHLELLWAFVAKVTPQGNVGKYSDAVIADKARWRGKPAAFVQALTAAGFLDVDAKHRLLIHDWPEHCPNWVRAKLKKDGLKFCSYEPVLSADLRADLSAGLKSGENTPSSPTNTRSPSPTTCARVLPSLTKPSLTKPSAQSAREDRKLGPSATEQPVDTWESHRQWALGPLRSAYPSNLDTEADWQIAVRTIAGRLEAAETTREELLQLTQDFSAQQEAKGNRNTQYIENPVRHFDGRGKWKGPFRLPATPQKPATPERPRRRTADEIEAEERARVSG